MRMSSIRYFDQFCQPLKPKILIIILHVMLLREILQHFQSQEQPGVFQDISFREKDTSLLRQQCQRKYNQYLDMQVQRLELDQKLQRLKEELCRINPQALEEIERDCSQKNDSQDDGAARGKRGKVVAKVGNGKIGKKNQRRKKTPKLTYS